MQGGLLSLTQGWSKSSPDMEGGAFAKEKGHPGAGLPAATWVPAEAGQGLVLLRSSVLGAVIRELPQQCIMVTPAMKQTDAVTACTLLPQIQSV